MRLWVTRSEPGAARTGARLAALGHLPLIAPLLRLERLPVGGEVLEAALEGAGALAFTSRSGVEAFAALCPARDLPVFAVGSATAASARAAGWTQVADADGDGAALARLIAQSRPTGVVLAPGAREPAFDLSTALAAAAIDARALPLYASSPERAPPFAVREAMAAGALDGLLLHSPAAARALASCAAADAGFAQTLRPLAAYALSPACAAPASRLLDRAPACAAVPRERDLLALLSAR